MKKITFACALLCAATAGHAQDLQNGAPMSAAPQAQPSQPPQAPRFAVKKMHYMIGMGITGGGEEVATTEFTDGTSQKVTTGGLVQFTGGVEYRVNEQFSVQGNVGFHVDNSTASNGDVHFRRYPIELIGYYHVSPQWRVGGGVRHVTNVRVKSSGVIGGLDTEFDNTTGALGEVEYLFSPNLGVKFRVARETYTVSGTNFKVDGNHVGVFGNFYF